MEKSPDGAPDSTLDELDQLGKPTPRDRTLHLREAAVSMTESNGVRFETFRDDGAEFTLEEWIEISVFLMGEALERRKQLGKPLPGLFSLFGNPTAMPEAIRDAFERAGIHSWARESDPAADSDALRESDAAPIMCECEHEHHFGATPMRHPYGEAPAGEPMHAVHTPRGRFVVCESCANACMKQYPSAPIT